MREICTQPCGAVGAGLRLPITLVNVSPSSKLSCRLPSSVPIQITPGREGDSRICVASEFAAYPSCLDAMGLSPETPMMACSGAQRLTFLLRSVGFIHHVSPRLLDLKKYCAAM